MTAEPHTRYRYLLPPVLRATPWIGFIPAGVIAVTMGLVAGQQPAGVEGRYLPTRLAILAVVIAVGFVFDDPVAPVTDPAPSPLRVRRLIRAVSAVVLVSGLFVAVLPLAADDMVLVPVMGGDDAVPVAPEEETNQPAPEFPWGRLAVETATMTGFVLAAAAGIARRGESEPGRLATSVLLGTYAVTWIIPDSHRPWASPGEQRWETGADWWWVAVVVVWLAATVLSWDSRIGWRWARSGDEPAGSSEDAVVGEITYRE